MLVQRSKVVLKEDYQNVLMKDFEARYEGVETLDNPQRVTEVMNGVFHLADMAEEYLYLVCMNTKNRPLGFFEVAHGGCSMAAAGMREIFIRALLCGAAGIVVVHNHPSGVPEPSDADISYTKKVQAAAELMGIAFCDHVIIGRGSYYSFIENDRMR